MRSVACVAVACLGACASEAAEGVQMVSCDARPGVGGASEFLDLQVGFNVAAVSGARVKSMTYDSTDTDRIYAVADVRVSSEGVLEQTWTDAYKRFEYQPIVYYVDIDDNGECTPDVDLGERFISSAWNPVGDTPLESDLAVFPIPMVTVETCRDVERCWP